MHSYMCLIKKAALKVRLLQQFMHRLAVHTKRLLIYDYSTCNFNNRYIHNQKQLHIFKCVTPTPSIEQHIKVMSPFMFCSYKKETLTKYFFNTLFGAVLWHKPHLDTKPKLKYLITIVLYRPHSRISAYQRRKSK